MSTPAYGGVIPMNHMNPKKIYDEFNSSTEKSPEQINSNNLKNYLGNTTKTSYRQNPAYMNPNMTLMTPSAYNILRDEVSHNYNNQINNNMTNKDIKKIENLFPKIYEPHKNKNILLLEESQVTVPKAQEELFNNRYKVLSKMNRLSNILLAKENKNLEKKENEFNTKTNNRNNSIRDWQGNLKNKCDDRLSKIIKIQSVFRGRFARKYICYLLYLHFLYESFCKKIENVLSNHARLDFTQEIKDIIKKFQESKDIITIRNFKNKLGKIPSIINLYKISIDLLNHNINKLKFDLEREKKFNKELKLNIKKLETILSDKEKEIKEEKKQKNDLIAKINEIKNISINNNLLEIIEKKEKLKMK